MPRPGGAGEAGTGGAGEAETGGAGEAETGGAGEPRPPGRREAIGDRRDRDGETVGTTDGRDGGDESTPRCPETG